MASGDVVFETSGLQVDTFAVNTNKVGTSNNLSVDVDISFGVGAATLNGSAVQVKDAALKLSQGIAYDPSTGNYSPDRLEPDSPFDANKKYKIQIVEV